MPLPSAALRVVRRFLLVAVALCLTTASAARAQDVLTEVSQKEMTKLLTSMGLEVSETETAVTEGGKPPLQFDLGGYRTLLFLLNENTDAQLYVGFRGQVSAEKINEWNRTHRFARAYRDADGEAVLEADIDFTGGVSEANIKAWVKLYRDLMGEYARYLNQGD